MPMNYQNLKQDRFIHMRSFQTEQLILANRLLTTFDLAFYPKERGPYNFEYRNTKSKCKWKFIEPKRSMGRFDAQY